MIVGVLLLAGAAAVAGASQQESAAGAYFTDVELVNQDGRALRFYSDLIKGRTVIIIPFFSSCTSACPTMNHNLEKIQEWLADRLGKEAHIISLTVDPANDTVEKLQAYARSYHARPGWHFLGGTPENVATALKKLGQHVDVPDEHTNIMIVGNERTGLWKKAFGLADSAALIRIVQSVIDDKGETPQ